MDKNKMILYPEDVKPVVKYANYIEVYHQSWPQHSIADLELVYIVEGEFTAQDPKHELTPLTPGDVVLIRSGYPCDLMFQHGNPAVISCIHFELLPDASYRAGDYEIGPRIPWVIHSDYVVLELFRKVAVEYLQYSIYRDSILSTLVKEIWLRLMLQEQSESSTPFPLRIRQMIEWSRKHLHLPITRQDLAREFGLTPEYINFLFQHYLRVTPGEFMKRERINLAIKLLLTTQLRIHEIAEKVGFHDALYFSRVFRQTMGVSPSVYRKR